MNTYAATIGKAPAAVGRVRVRRRRRAAIATAGLAAFAFALFVATLTIGSTFVPPLDVIASVVGLSADPGVNFIVQELRLPAAGAALCAGLALGVSGTLFQQLLRNPLASPELIGISAGSSLTAVAGIVLLAWTGYAISGAALAGAIGAAFLIYSISWRGGISGYRLILVGIGISEFMLAMVAYLIARSEIRDAREATHWLAGSVGQAGTGELVALIAAVLVLVPIALVLTRGLRALELGDDTARALGTRVETVRLALIAVAVCLVGFATAVVGPLAFVALVAGPVAQRVIGPTQAPIVAAAFVGAAMVLASDLVAQQVLPVALPTGVVTGAVGAPYLLWVLATMNREGRGG